MKQFAVYFLMIIAIILSGGVGSAEAPSTAEAVEKSGGEAKPPIEGKKGEFKEGAGFGQQGLSEKEKTQIEDLKARFRRLVEDEMKQFGVLEETVPEEDKKEEYLTKKREAGEGGEFQKEVAVEKREEEIVPQLKESEGEVEEEKVGEEAEEEALEEEVFEEVIPVEPERPEEGREKIALDFEDADIKEVITALADIIGINYIVDPKIRGRVNIHTSGEISMEDIFPILETILEVNNVAAVKVGNIYKIIPVKQAKQQPLIPKIGRELEDTPSPDRLLLQIVPLRYIPPKEMEKIIKPFLGRGGTTVDYAERNILIIVDTAFNMKKLMSLIDTLDVSVFDTMHVRFYEIENSEAKDLAKELEKIFKAMGIETKRKKGGELVSFIPIERMNIILAVSSMPEIFDKVTEWIGKLDGVREELEEQIFIYFVENAKASDIGDVIKEVYGERRSERDRRRTTSRKTKGKTTKTSTRLSKTKTGLGTTTGEVKIVVDEINNALIIRATPQDYAQILKTVKLLDTIPKQVLIEVLIAEVTLDENTEFGLEWSIASDYASLGGYKGLERVGQNVGLGGLGLDLAQPIAQTGFTYAFASQGLVAFLRAQARQNKVDILSSPHILVADNTEATIEVGQEVPIVTSEYTPSQLASETATFSRSIEYRDTGILLTVTPRINEKGLVAMEINQEVSEVSEQRIEGINSPIILKRQARTSLVVQDGKTIIIGGLIREKKDSTKEGIPFLYKLPYIGMLFSFTKEVRTKTELLMMITPHVVQTFEEAEFITREFREKLESLKKMLGK